MSRMGLTALVALTLLAPVAPTAAASEARGSISGVQKVIQMLTDMAAKAKEEKKEEEVAYSKFNTWCLMETAKLEKSIAKDAQEIESLTSEISELENKAAELKAEVAELNGEVIKFDADMKAATAQREKDHEAFVAEDQDYSESVDALGRAIEVLKSQDVDRKGASAALLQLGERQWAPAKVRSVVTALLSMVGTSKDSAESDADPLDYAAPEANAYEFQSTSIVEMLKKLEDEFRAKLGQCQKEEMNSKYAYSMVMIDLKDAKENAEQDIADKTIEMERKLKKAAADKKELAATQATKEANEKVLKDMTTECFEKSLSYQEKQKLRKEEIEAIEKAAEIMSSPEVSGAAEKHLGFAQVATKGVASLVQADRRDSSSEGSRQQGLRHHVREFLETEAKRLKSKTLGMLVEKIMADPFVKVKKLIDQMITRLLKEAKADADHEGFCDTEMGKSKMTRTRLSEQIDALSASVEEGKATILELTSSTETLSKEVSELITAMKEATELRAEEKKTNALTVEDAVAAQKAVAAAMAVLKDFYKKAMVATGFVQVGNRPEWGLNLGIKMGSDEWNSLANPDYKGSGDTGHKEGMQTFGATEKGEAKDEAEYGVLALLEVIQSDFANVEATTKATEAESQKAYDQLMIECKKSQAKKERKIEMNNADKASAESQLQEDIADLKATQDELIAAEKYHERLVPQCIDKGMTFEERTKAREAEMASLKEALQILDSDDITTSA